MKLIIDRLRELVRIHPNGFTYDPSTDVILNKDSYPSEDEVYVYSLDLKAQGVRRANHWVNIYPIEAILYSYFDDFNYASKTFIGYWYKDGEDYWDISKVSFSLKDAMLQGIDNNQEYIYDLINQRDIKVE